MGDILLRGFASDCGTTVHHLPCAIKFDGPARVATFFVPAQVSSSATAAGGVDSPPSAHGVSLPLARQEAYFRGRLLEGHAVELPEGVVGLVVQEAIAARTSDQTGVTTASPPPRGKTSHAATTKGRESSGVIVGRAAAARGGYGPKSGYGSKAAAVADDDDDDSSDIGEDIGFTMPPSDDDEDAEDAAVSDDLCASSDGVYRAGGSSSPAGDVGTAAPSTITREADGLAEPGRVWRIDGAFSRATYWTHDTAAGDTDLLRTGADWFALASAVSQIPCSGPRFGVSCVHTSPTHARLHLTVHWCRSTIRRLELAPAHCQASVARNRGGVPRFVMQRVGLPGSFARVASIFRWMVLIILYWPFNFQTSV